MEICLAKAGADLTNLDVAEQQLVDCTRSTEENEERFGTNYGMGGCRGGWFTSPWRFMRD